MIEAPAQVTVSDLPLQTQSGNPLIRWALFLFCVAVVCPIRYYAESYGVDISWVQAMNLAAWKGLAVGRDIIWTTGPLSHLVFPLDIGSNLTEALRFQYAIWLLMGAVLADVFFSSGARVRNLALFSLYLAFSAPLYWFNFVGLDGLLTTGVLLLLTMVFLSGGTTRYVAALILTGLLPMVKLTAGMVTGGAIAGFVAHRFLTKHAERWHALVLAAVVPTVTMAGMSWLLLPSIDAAKTYVLASLEVARNYSSAMATVGDAIEIAGAAQTLAWISVVLFIVWRGDSSKGRFAALLLGLPLLVSFKHGFVRQDMHVIIYFCFAAVVLAILSLLLPDSRKPFYNATLVVFAYTVTWAGYATLRVGPDAYWQSAGIQGLQLAAKTTDVTALRRHLARRSDREYPAELALDPEIRGAIGSQSVAILSVAFHRDMMRHLNVELYPVIQRYSAYSPYLDEWNARWIREKGPRFLLFDGSAIDDRHLWTETPAMWLEIYRHYNTRLSKTR
ncbi:MAG TPA: hypothetical protein VER03_06875, partial [Bryobacteraceae bacterium]|nr:hypothetical protein [Bryobacteraceae bacterium]